MKYGIAAVLMCMSPILLAAPQYQIDVKVENHLQVLDFAPFQVSEGRWGGAALFPKSGGTKRESCDLINQISQPTVPHA